MQTAILELTKQALREIGASAIPTSLLSGTTDANQVLAFVYAESRFLRNQKVFPQNKQSYTITLEANRSKYPLPVNFYTPLRGTVWDGENSWPLLGPLGDADWANLTQGYVSVGVRRSFRVLGIDGNQYTDGGQFEIYPTPTAGGATITLEYQNEDFFRPPFWTPSTAYSSAVPNYVSSNGRNYVCTTSGTSSATDPVSGTGTGITDGTVVWSEYTTPMVTLLSDTHFSVYDDDILISGIKWRYEKSKGVAFDIDPMTGVPALHMKLVNAAAGRFNGMKIISMVGGGARYPSANVPDGNWSI